MAEWRTHFNVKGIRALQDQRRVSEQYKQCRKILPHVDTLLTERMKSQTAVETSLMQALFSELKAVMRVNVSSPLYESRLILDDLDLDHYYDRLVIYIMCAATLFMCLITVIMSCKMRLDILDRVDTVMRETGINSIVRADPPISKNEPLMSGYRSGTKSKTRRVPISISEENMEAVAQAMNQRIQTRGVKSKSPLPPVTITT